MRLLDVLMSHCADASSTDWLGLMLDSGSSCGRNAECMPKTRVTRNSVFALGALLIMAYTSGRKISKTLSHLFQITGVF